MKQTRYILHVTPGIGRSSFGIGPIVLNLAAAQQSLGNIIKIWCYDAPEEARALEIHYGLNEKTIRCFPVIGPSQIGYSPILERAIVEEGYTFNIVHQHSIWTAISRGLNQWRKHTQGPTLITPQGALEPYAIRKSHWKKRLALKLYEQQNLHASHLQALSMQEVVDFRTFGLYGPITVIPNGISHAWISHISDPQRFRSQHNISDKVSVMLFLSRITPKKGLPMLLQAMNRCRDLLDGWILCIAGVNEFNHQQEVQRLVEKLKLQAYVQFVGPKFDLDKRDAFSAADVFVLPSHSEGAPIAILEALGSGCPVLTTKASPWEDIVIHDCGWWTDISVEAIANALQDVLQQPKTVLWAKGQRGKQLVSRKYTWLGIAEQTLALYEWLIDGSEQPDLVVME